MGYYESKRRGALVNPTMEMGNVNASTNALMGNLNNFVSNQRQQDAANVEQAQREEALALEAEKYKAAQTRLATQDAMTATAFNTQQQIRNNQLAEYDRKVDQRDTLADLNKNFTTVGMKQGMGLTEADINAQYSKANDAYEKKLVDKGLNKTNYQIAAMSPKERDAWRESTKGLYTDPFDNGKGTGQADFEKKYLKSFNTATDATYVQRHDAIIKAYTDKGIPLDVAEQQAALRLKGVQTEAQKAESFSKAAKEQYDRENDIYKTDYKYWKAIVAHNDKVAAGGVTSTGGSKNTLANVFATAGVKADEVSGNIDAIDSTLKEVNKALKKSGTEALTTSDISPLLVTTMEDSHWFTEGKKVNTEALKSLILDTAHNKGLTHTKKGNLMKVPNIKEPKYKTYKPKKAKTAQELLDIYKSKPVKAANTLGKAQGNTVSKNTTDGTTLALKGNGYNGVNRFDLMKGGTVASKYRASKPAPETANLTYLRTLLDTKGLSTEGRGSINRAIKNLEIKEPRPPEKKPSKIDSSMKDYSKTEAKLSNNSWANNLNKYVNNVGDNGNTLIKTSTTRSTHKPPIPIKDTSAEAELADFFSDNTLNDLEAKASELTKTEPANKLMVLGLLSKESGKHQYSEFQKLKMKDTLLSLGYNLEDVADVMDYYVK